MFNHIVAEFFRARKALSIKILFAMGILFPMAVFLIPRIAFDGQMVENVAEGFLLDIASFSFLGGLYATMVLVIFTYKKSDIMRIYSSYKSSRLKAYLEDLLSIIFLITVFCIFEIILCLSLAWLGSLIDGVKVLYIDDFFREIYYNYLISLNFVIVFFAFSNVFNSTGFGLLTTLVLVLTGELMRESYRPLIRMLGNFLRGFSNIPIDRTIPHHIEYMILSLLLFTFLGIFSYKRREL